MSVLIIKRELSGTKQLKSHYQTSLQKEGRKDGREGGEETYCIFICHININIDLFSPSPFFNWLCCCQACDDASTLYVYVCQC